MEEKQATEKRQLYILSCVFFFFFLLFSAFCMQHTLCIIWLVLHHQLYEFCTFICFVCWLRELKRIHKIRDLRISKYCRKIHSKENYIHRGHYQWSKIQLPSQINLTSNYKLVSFVEKKREKTFFKLKFDLKFIVFFPCDCINLNANTFL